MFTDVTSRQQRSLSGIGEREICEIDVEPGSEQGIPDVCSPCGCLRLRNYVLSGSRIRNGWLPGSCSILRLLRLTLDTRGIDSSRWDENGSVEVEA